MDRARGTGAYRSCGVYAFVWAGKKMPRYRFSNKLMKVLSERGGGKERERDRKPLSRRRKLREALAAGAGAELPHPLIFLPGVGVWTRAPRGPTGKAIGRPREWERKKTFDNVGGGDNALTSDSHL